MDHREKIAKLRLIRTENVGPITFNRLIDRFGTAMRALDALPALAARGGKKEMTAYPLDAAEKEFDQLTRYGAVMITRDDAAYPPLLAEVEDAPPVLTVLGNPELLSRQGLGVVGARNASLVGRKIAESFSQKIGSAGYIINSGLARGIDSAAHQVTLETGTVAVIAGGIDVVYPKENEKLYRDIAARGAIVAESPFGTEPLARHFPRRNRIISGLSLGVLVVEAAEKSGSLITARMALEQNREVFAVPGSPLDPRAGGTNSLLKDGAHIATSADDILQVLRSLRHQMLRENRNGRWDGPLDAGEAGVPDAGLQARILDSLNLTPVGVDEVIRAVQAPTGYVMTALLELELAGRVQRHPGHKISLTGL